MLILRGALCTPHRAQGGHFGLRLSMGGLSIGIKTPAFGSEGGERDWHHETLLGEAVKQTCQCSTMLVRTAGGKAGFDVRSILLTGSEGKEV